jgi:hypothetical protein
MDKMLIFVSLNGIVDFLSTIESLQKSIQSGSPIAHKVYKIMQNLSNRFENFQISNEVVNLLRGLSISNRNKVEEVLHDFHNEVKNKWISTCARNLSDDIFGDNGLFKKLQVFNPFEKFLQNQHFDYYKKFVS